ncbi:T9SS type A sorting domain-containing protein [candidate division WOR-3 bacterium]|nr:T9SS type A sorting domain-containing protein [candidate division WOR-3 bacterium]
MKGLKITIGLLVIAVLSCVAYSQTQWVWRVLPYSEFGISDSPPPYGLVQNNGWAVAKAYPRSGWYDSIDTIHVVFTENGYYRLPPDKRPRVYWRFTTNGGRTWSEGLCLSAELHHEQEGEYDSAYDATIGCLGDTIAVAFYDQWHVPVGDSDLPHQIAYTHKHPQIEDWIDLVPLIRSLNHKGAKHPSLALQRRVSHIGGTWRLGANILYSETKISSDTMDVDWIDAPTENLIKILPEFHYRPEMRMGANRDTTDYLTVAWDGDDDAEHMFYYAFQKMKSDGTWQIRCGRKEYSGGVEEISLTGAETLPPQGQQPSIQAITHDTVVVAYVSPAPGALNSKIYVAIVKRQQSIQQPLVIIRNEPAFPDQGVYWPNLWHKGDTVFMVFIGRLMQTYFSYSTNRGQSWQTPKPVSGYLSLTPSVTTTDFGRAYFVYATLNPQKFQHLRFREVRAVASPVVWPPVEVDGISAGNARVLQQIQVPGDYFVRAYPVEDFIAVDRSTDGGLTWEDIFSPGWGKNPSIATDGDSAVAAFFVEGCTLYCAWWYPNVMDWTEPQVVFAEANGVIPANPSVALYPGKVNGVKVAAVTFAVYDTVGGTSKIMFAKVDTGTVILDTIDTKNDLTDSFPCINIANTDSVYVTYQRGAEVVGSALYDYAAGTTERPPVWKALGSIGDGYHPMSEIEGGILHCVWTKRVENNGVPDSVVICHSTCDVTDAPQFAGWQAGANSSYQDTTDKANPVYAGIGVTVWNELVNGKWAIKAKVRDSIRTLVANSHNCRYPQSLAESSAISPSIDQIRLALLWSEEVAPDTAVLGFKVDSFNVSHAGANATRINNGTKLIRKANSDSLYAVYTDLDGAVMFARSANGDSWKRDVLAEGCEFPAIAEDGTGRKWAVMNYTGNTHANAVEACYLKTNGDWSNAQTLYSFAAQGSAGPLAIAAASDGNNPCCYAAFLYNNGAGKKYLIVAKFNGDSLRIDTVAQSSNLDDPAIAVEPDAQGDYLHLVWSDNGEVKYTMSESRIQANNWSGGFPSDWKDAVNLSNSQVPSVHPVIGANESRVVVSWAEGVIPDVFARQRSTADEYNNWQEAVNLSNTQDYISDYPTIAAGDTVLISYQEEGENGDYDIMVAVEFNEPLNICDNPTASTYPQVLFEKKPAGDTTIPYLHCIWSEEPSQNYYEVRYHKLNLKQTGGGGQQSGAGFELLAPRLYQSAPNPFSTRMQIRYQIGQEGDVRLKVYDTQGRLVKSLVSAKQKPGSYTVIWDGKDERNRQVPYGIYFYRLDAPHFSDTKKAVFLR